MDKKKKVEIIPGCISCGTCEAICPQVFEVRDVAYVKPNTRYKDHADDVDEAVDMCPVSVIQVNEEEDNESNTGS